MKHTAEHYKYYLMATAVLIGFVALIMGFVMYAMSGPFSLQGQSVMFSLVMIIAGTIFTSTVFADLGDKKKAIATLTLPASHLEKYLVGWVYSFLIFQVVYSACFYLVLYSVLPLDDWGTQEPEYLPLFSGDYDKLVFLMLFLFLHAVSFWGSIFFAKWHFIKTAFLFFVIAGVLMFLNKLFMEQLLGVELENASPFSNLGIMEGEQYYKVLYPEEKEGWLAIVPLGLGLLLWATAYFRLKEKDI